MSEIKYVITKEQAQDDIDKYGHVCSCCGGKLEPIETVDNAQNPTFWIGCLSCQRFNFGCKPETFAIAKKMVEEHGFYYYVSKGKWQDNEIKKSNISKAVELIELIERIKK